MHDSAASYINQQTTRHSYSLNSTGPTPTPTPRRTSSPTSARGSSREVGVSGSPPTRRAWPVQLARLVGGLLSDARFSSTCTAHDKLSCTRLQNYTIGASLKSVSVSVSLSVAWNLSFRRSRQIFLHRFNLSCLRHRPIFKQNSNKLNNKVILVYII